MISTTTPWLKIGLLLVAAASVDASLSPPQPPVPPKQQSGPSLFNRIVRYMCLLTKSLTWVLAIIDAVMTLCTVYAPTSTAAISLCRRAPSTPTSLTIPSTLFVVAVASCVAGALLRKWCYVTLGRLFTFEVSIMPKHQLVVSGPYAWIRHPSYTGLHLTLVGVTVMLGARGSWARECGMLGWGSTADVFAWWFAGFWVVKCGFAVYSTTKRVRVEDEELRKTFGPAWEEYAKRVRFALVPWVF